LASRDVNYWEQRFNSGDTPWELGAASQALFEAVSEVYPDERVLHGLKVLAPGCGTGADAFELARRGAAVTALDWSPHACARLKERITRAKLQNVQGDVQVVHGDFFVSSPELVDLVCEHTFFCAIDPIRRPDYVQAVVRWLRPGGYLIGNFFILPESEITVLPGLSLAKGGDGPPFASTERELLGLLNPYFDTITLRPASKGESSRRAGMEWMGIFRRR
jgi:SAM-dependent methyltransferase